MEINKMLLMTLTTWLPAWLSSTNEQVFRSFNSLAGRSWILDTIVSLCLENDLVKAGLVGACFVAAWYATDNPPDARRIRRTLIITVIASAAVVASTKMISHTVFYPRPWVRTEATYLLENGELVREAPLQMREPLDDSTRTSMEGLRRGVVDDNDLESLPSDHAGFFLLISLGIFLANRRLGAIATAWTLLCISTCKMIAGQHTPLDIVTGVLTAIVVLAVFQFLGQKGFRSILDRVSDLSLKYSALSAVCVFAIAFEISRTLGDVRPLAKTGIQIAKHIVKGGH